MPTLVRVNENTWKVTGDTEVILEPPRGIHDLDRILTSAIYRDQGQDWRWDPSLGEFVVVTQPAEA